MSQAPAAKTVIRASITAALAITALAVTASAPAQAATTHATSPAQRSDVPSPVTDAGGVGALLAPGPDLASGLVGGALDGVTGLLPI